MWGAIGVLDTHTYTHTQWNDQRETGAERNAMLNKLTWKRKLLQAASILRHSDGDYKVSYWLRSRRAALACFRSAQRWSRHKQPPVLQQKRRASGIFLEKREQSRLQKICLFLSHWDSLMLASKMHAAVTRRLQHTGSSGAGRVR